VNFPVEEEEEEGSQDPGADVEERERFVSDTSVSGWLDLRSDPKDTAGLFLLGDRQRKRLDGGLMTAEVGDRLLLPEVRLEDGMQTEVTLLNPHLSFKTASIELLNERGQLVNRVSKRVIPRGALIQFVKDPDPDDSATSGLFPDSVFEPCDTTVAVEGEDQIQDRDEEDTEEAIGCGFERGYITVTTIPDQNNNAAKEEKGGTLLGYERYFNREGMSALNAVRLSDEGTGPSKHFVPQVVAFQGCETFITLVNSGVEWLSLTLRLKDSQGIDAAVPAQLTLRAGHMIRQSVVELFDLANVGNLVTGWLLIEADGPGLVGDAELRLSDGKAMTTFPLLETPVTELLFPYFAEGGGVFTGLAFVNTQEELANVSLDAFDENGDMAGHLDFSIPPQGRVSQLLVEYIGGLGSSRGYIKVHSDRALVGLESIFEQGLEWVSSTVPQ
jgi:hypothetical protein